MPFVPADCKLRVRIPLWIKEKLFMKKLLRRQLNAIWKKEIPFYFPEHHLSHAASAYYPSPFQDAAILTIAV